MRSAVGGDCTAQGHLRSKNGGDGVAQGPIQMHANFHFHVHSPTWAKPAQAPPTEMASMPPKEMYTPAKSDRMRVLLTGSSALSEPSATTCTTPPSNLSVTLLGS